MRIILPWTMVLHDNHRLMPVILKKRARLITAPEYRANKTKAEYEIKRQYKGEPLKGDVRLTAYALFPDKRKRDAGNYRKLITDALSGLCYEDDSQLVAETWERAGYDKVNPRIEINLEAA